MVRHHQGMSVDTVEILIQTTLQMRQMSRKDHLQLTSVILSNPAIQPVHRRQINRIFEYIRVGQVKLID
ncbi:MAG: hypothetical protein AAF215_12870 [Cyanobacteria bacterium P01_A01_bin.123]